MSKQAVFFRTKHHWWHNEAMASLAVASLAAARKQADSLEASCFSYGGQSYQRFEAGWERI